MTPSPSGEVTILPPSTQCPGKFGPAIEIQGDPNQNLKCLLATTLKLCISDPMLVKPKCVWEAYNFFDFQLFVFNFSKKMYASQTHFGFTNMGSKTHIFRVMSSQRVKNVSGTPCNYVKLNFAISFGIQIPNFHDRHFFLPNFVMKIVTFWVTFCKLIKRLHLCIETINIKVINHLINKVIVPCFISFQMGNIEYNL